MEDKYIFGCICVIGAVITGNFALYMGYDGTTLATLVGFLGIAIGAVFGPPVAQTIRALFD